MGNILKKLIFLSVYFSLFSLERRSRPKPLSVYNKLSRWDRLKQLIPHWPHMKIVDVYENTKKKKD